MICTDIDYKVDSQGCHQARTAPKGVPNAPQSDEVDASCPRRGHNDCFQGSHGTGRYSVEAMSLAARSRSDIIRTRPCRSESS
jgi:hypothetical protein